MNKEQLEESIKYIYGDIDAHAYLQKFVNLELRLPKRQMDGRNQSDISKYTRSLYKLHEIEMWEDEERILTYVESLAKHFGLSLRQLEKVFTSLAVL